MKKIFEIIGETTREGEMKKLRVGIRIQMADYETLCPLSESFSSYPGIQEEVGRLKTDLDDLLEQAEKIFRGDSSDGGLGLTAEMNAEQIWGILAKVSDDHAFVQGFNELEETRRREVAEHVLTKCNVFSGRASFFSARFNEASGLME